jgi:hypothetical protein
VWGAGSGGEWLVRRDVGMLREPVRKGVTGVGSG